MALLFWPQWSILLNSDPGTATLYTAQAGINQAKIDFANNPAAKISLNAAIIRVRLWALSGAVHMSFVDSAQCWHGFPNSGRVKAFLAQKFRAKRQVLIRFNQPCDRPNIIF